MQAAEPGPLASALNDRWLNVAPAPDCRWQNTVYEHGNLAAWRLTGNPAYLDAVSEYAVVGCQGQVPAIGDLAYDASGQTYYTHPDALAAGKVFLGLSETTAAVPSALDSVIRTLNLRINAPLDSPAWISTGSPSQSSPDGVYEWTFLDWFYMAGPVMAEAGKLCIDSDAPAACLEATRFENPYWKTLFDLYLHMRGELYAGEWYEGINTDAQNLFFMPAESACAGLAAFDPEDRLFWHDVNKIGDCDLLWGRGHGWAMAAYADVLGSVRDGYSVWR